MEEQTRKQGQRGKDLATRAPGGGRKPKPEAEKVKTYGVQLTLAQNKAIEKKYGSRTKAIRTLLPETSQTDKTKKKPKPIPWESRADEQESTNNLQKGHKFDSAILGNVTITEAAFQMTITDAIEKGYTNSAELADYTRSETFRAAMIRYKRMFEKITKTNNDLLLNIVPPIDEKPEPPKYDEFGRVF